MIESAESVWIDLFGRSAGEPSAWRCRLIRRQGRPLVFLPADARRAAATLDLYAAQSLRARCFKNSLRGLARAGFPLPLPVERLPQPGDAELMQALKSWGVDLGAREPAFGLFVGNGAPSIRRFLLLAFDAAGNPLHVIKLGTGAGARDLVRREREFLANAPPSLQALPALVGGFSSKRVDALVLKHVPGVPPRGVSTPEFARVLNAWLLPQAPVPFFELPALRELAECPFPESFSAVRARLESLRVSPVLFHGDFAPWNVRVSAAGEWTILDWERASLAGPPGWDWFHFVLQPEVLVHRRAPAALERKVEELLQEPLFQAYAARAIPNGYALDWLIAYLLWMVLVVRPEAGGAPTLGLAERLLRRSAAQRPDSART